jgi:translation initiation factor 2D
VEKCFQLITSEQLAVVVPNKEEMTTMKIYTSSGESVTVYCLSKNPVFFEINKELFPTGIYTLESLYFVCTTKFHFKEVF